MLIARALILEPQLLLMDEPGNHMDIAAMAKLSQFLGHDCQCPFLMISHDQHLLDNVCTKTIFLRDKRTYEFDLPFEQARERLTQEDEIAANRRSLEEKEIKRLQGVAKRMAIWGREHDNEKLSRKAKSIEKRAEKLDQNKTEVSKGSPLSLSLKGLGLGAKQVLSIENCNITTPDGQRQLLNIEQVFVKPGDRVALLGVNGVGKSSTLEIIRKKFAAQDVESGSIRFNPRVELGYYDQKLASLNQQQTRLDWLRMHTTAKEEELKRTLINAGVSYQDFDRKVNTLSGGEKARMMFMSFALNQPNFMILDEPTNHIDLAGKEQLTEQLMDSGATLLMTSHDRHFLDKVATRWLWIEQGKLHEVTSAAAFYDSLVDFQPVRSRSTNSVDKRQADVAQSIDCEDAILERIDVLEAKLNADKGRKAKFQKLDQQLLWQAELDELWAKVS
jgi:ATPase subunit of ABC transporter with duplicated ATPase domains